MTGSKRLIRTLKERGLTIATAESLTGGLLGSSLVDVPGASAAYLGGICTYTDRIKHKLLGVSKESLRRHGAVSETVAIEMANGIRQKTDADLAVSATGFAGPDSDGGIPVGRVYIGVSTRAGTCYAVQFDFSGTRNLIRKEAARAAIDEILLLLGKDGKIK